MNHKTKTNLFIDLILLVVFLIAYEERATGTAIHEWLGVAFVVFLLVHIILHWKWLVEMTGRFYGPLKTGTRINYILDILIYLGFTTIIFTGLMISESVIPFFGIRSSESHYWQEIHLLSVDITLFLVAIHFALHWKWIVDKVKYHVIRPIKNMGASDRKPKVARPISTRQKGSFISDLGKVGFPLIFILALSGLISLGWYAASDQSPATTRRQEHRMSDESHREFRAQAELKSSHERFDRQERGHQHGNRENHSEGGHHEEGGFFGMELLKNLLIFALITFAVYFINKVVSTRKKLRPSING